MHSLAQTDFARFLPFDSGKIDYAKRLSIRYTKHGKPIPPAPLAPERLYIRGKSGAIYEFLLHRFVPFFEPQPSHLFSRCGRVIVMRNKLYNDDNEYIGVVPDQYFVYYKGKRLPDSQFSIRKTLKPRLKSLSRIHPNTGKRFSET